MTGDAGRPAPCDGGAPDQAADDGARDLDRPARDAAELVDLLEVHLLGEQPSLTGQQIADDVGIALEETQTRWRSLGFAAVDADVPAFTHADLEAVRLTQQLLDLGVVEGEDQQALVRSLGRSFARLAEWQMGLLARQVDVEHTSLRDLEALLDQVTPAIEQLQSYVWRRHALLAASRLALAAERRDDPQDPLEQPGGGESASYADGTVMGVGFADIVGYTRHSRSLTRRELARFVDGFEGRALEIVTGHGGRIIKTIGDEVLFVADDPEHLARIGLDLVEEQEAPAEDDFPELRVGLAWGRALARLGDVLGPVVDIAARLTSAARPGTVLVDRAMADHLCELPDDDLRVRRVPRVSARGYRRLEPWVLRRS